MWAPDNNEEQDNFSLKSESGCLQMSIILSYSKSYIQVWNHAFKGQWQLNYQIHRSGYVPVILSVPQVMVRVCSILFHCQKLEKYPLRFWQLPKTYAIFPTMSNKLCRPCYKILMLFCCLPSHVFELKM